MSPFPLSLPPGFRHARRVATDVALVAAVAALVGTSLLDTRDLAGIRLTLDPYSSYGAPPPVARQLRSAGVLAETKKRFKWTGSADSLERRLFVTQHGDEQRATLIARGDSAAEAERLVRAWATAFAMYRRDLQRASPNALPDPSFERKTAVWGTHVEGGALPTLTYTTDRRYVSHGRRALLVRAPESAARQRKFVWQLPGIPVSPTQRYRVSAVVSARAGERGPVFLGVRRQTGEISQAGTVSARRTSRLARNAFRRRLSMLFVVPAGSTNIEIALWQEVRPRRQAEFAVDAVSITRAGPIEAPDVKLAAVESHSSRGRVAGGLGAAILATAGLILLRRARAYF